MRFIGELQFLNSTKGNRRTSAMMFDIAVDWFKSVTDYFQQEVMTANYDGSEILVNVYSTTDWEDEDSVIDERDLVISYEIRNMYY